MPQADMSSAFGAREMRRRGAKDALNTYARRPYHESLLRRQISDRGLNALRD
jgi:hypothetical protein